MSDTRKIRNNILKKILPSIGWLFLVFFLTTVATFFLIIPGIYLGVAFTLVLPVIFFEDTREQSPLFRSFDLVRGHWWLTFGIMAFYILITYTVSMFLYIPLYIIMFVTTLSSSDHEFSSNIYYIIYGNIVSTITIMINVFGTILLSFHYFNLVEKKEMPTLMSRIENIE